MIRAEKTEFIVYNDPNILNTIVGGIVCRRKDSRYLVINLRTFKPEWIREIDIMHGVAKNVTQISLKLYQVTGIESSDAWKDPYTLFCTIIDTEFIIYKSLKDRLWDAFFKQSFEGEDQTEITG